MQPSVIPDLQSESEDESEDGEGDRDGDSDFELHAQAHNTHVQTLTHTPHLQRRSVHRYVKRRRRGGGVSIAMPFPCFACVYCVLVLDRRRFSEGWKDYKMSTLAFLDVYLSIIYGWREGGGVLVISVFV